MSQSESPCASDCRRFAPDCPSGSPRGDVRPPGLASGGCPCPSPTGALRSLPYAGHKQKTLLSSPRPCAGWPQPLLLVGRKRRARGGSRICKFILSLADPLKTSIVSLQHDAWRMPGLIPLSSSSLPICYPSASLSEQYSSREAFIARSPIFPFGFLSFLSIS